LVPGCDDPRGQISQKPQPWYLQEKEKRFLPSCHIVETGNWHAAVCDGFSEIIPPKGLAIWHSHVKTGQSGGHPRMLAKPISDNKSIEP